MKTGNRNGFTLVELMIVVAIVAILASIAYPSYTQYAAKAKRATAKTGLSTVSGRLEQYFLDNKTYTTNLTLLGYPADPMYINSGGDWVAAAAGDNTYQIDITAADARTYSISAIPQNSQATQDDGCGTLTLNQAGTKGATGADGVAGCW